MPKTRGKKGKKKNDRRIGQHLRPEGYPDQQNNTNAVQNNTNSEYPVYDVIGIRRNEDNNVS